MQSQYPLTVLLAAGVMAVITVAVWRQHRRSQYPYGFPRRDERDTNNFHHGSLHNLVRSCEDPMEVYQERIWATALLHPSGIVYWVEPPLRHHNIIRFMSELGLAGNANTNPNFQGFVTTQGRFVYREEAFKIATAAKQIAHKSGNPRDLTLYSEDLWP